MEGVNSNFETVLADFESRLPGAAYISLDMELTGVDISGQPDTYAETVPERIAKLCAIAERYAPMQIGITLVNMELRHGHAHFTTFIFYSLSGDSPEFSEKPSFSCQVSAMRFNGQHSLDFNKWIREGIPYMSREAETKYLERLGNQTDPDLPQKLGLMRVWKAICRARKPLVVHGPLDLFFLLATFEKRSLPTDPKELGRLALRHLPCVFDTAYLHNAMAAPGSMKLTSFMDEARKSYEKAVASGHVGTLTMHLERETAIRYADGSDLKHEAGHDSLITAQLFAYLAWTRRAAVERCANCLFLYRSAEYFHLYRAAEGGSISGFAWDTSCITPLVAQLEKPDDVEVQRRINRGGYHFRRMDPMHLLVLLEADATDAVQRAAGLASKVFGVVEWSDLTQWWAKARAGSSSTHPAAGYCGSSELAMGVPQVRRTSGRSSSGLNSGGPPPHTMREPIAPYTPPPLETIPPWGGGSARPPEPAQPPPTKVLCEDSPAGASSACHALGSCWSGLPCDSTASRRSATGPPSQALEQQAPAQVPFQLFSQQALHMEQQPQCPQPLPLPEHEDLVSADGVSAVADGTQGSQPGKRYYGVIKSFDVTKGFGFIECGSLHSIYKRDVFLHRSQIGRCAIGWSVSFSVVLNARGQPQAQNVEAMDWLQWSMQKGSRSEMSKFRRLSFTMGRRHGADLDGSTHAPSTVQSVDETFEVELQ